MNTQNHSSNSEFKNLGKSRSCLHFYFISFTPYLFNNPCGWRLFDHEFLCIKFDTNKRPLIISAGNLGNSGKKWVFISIFPQEIRELQQLVWFLFQDILLIARSSFPYFFFHPALFFFKITVIRVCVIWMWHKSSQGL